jgi:hypothetical protein
VQAAWPHHPVNLHPFVIDDGASQAVGPVRVGTAAAVVMFTFSGDRPIEITRAVE